MRTMRHDHTRWLIHFVRDRKPDQDFPGDEEESGRFAGGELPADADAFSVLKTLVRTGGLLPGHSFRKGRTTLYGGMPVVCATEMPLYSLAKYVKSTGDHSKVSPYGIAFLKAEFFSAGGRPVIYGLSSSNPTLQEDTWNRRILHPSVLPIEEQYRYVAYSPSGDRWIDWSHEREWRWVARDKQRHRFTCKNAYGYYETVIGLPLFTGTTQGGDFSRLCIIVEKRDDASEIQELLTGLYFRGYNDYESQFDSHLILASRIIVLADVVEAVDSGRDLNAYTIEGLTDAGLVDSIIVHPPTKATRERVMAALQLASAAGKSAAEKFTAKYGDGITTYGFAYAVTPDVTSPFVQFMLENELASGPYSGLVRIKIPCSWSDSPSLDYLESVYSAAAEVLSKELDLDVFMTSKPD
jgi:hypothetical protein